MRARVTCPFGAANARKARPVCAPVALRRAGVTSRAGTPATSPRATPSAGSSASCCSPRCSRSVDTAAFKLAAAVSPLRQRGGHGKRWRFTAGEGGDRTPDFVSIACQMTSLVCPASGTKSRKFVLAPGLIEIQHARSDGCDRPTTRGRPPLARPPCRSESKARARLSVGCDRQLGYRGRPNAATSGRSWARCWTTPEAAVVVSPPS